MPPVLWETVSSLSRTLTISSSRIKRQLSASCHGCCITKPFLLPWGGTAKPTGSSSLTQEPLPAWPGSGPAAPAPASRWASSETASRWPSAAAAEPVGGGAGLGRDRQTDHTISVQEHMNFSCTCCRDVTPSCLSRDQTQGDGLSGGDKCQGTLHGSQPGLQPISSRLPHSQPIRAAG